jgi:hypothetical protein
MNAGTIAMVLVVTILIANMNETMGKREQQVSFDGAQATFTQLALAQYRRSTDFIDAANPALGLRGYADSPAQLHADGYLPVWVDHYDYWGVDLAGGTGFKITFDSGNVYAAQQIARRMGNLAEVAGDIVSVGFSSAAELALLDTFVKKQGDSMQGGLSFDAGAGSLDMNGNPIQSSGKLSFIGGSGDGIDMAQNDIAAVKVVYATKFDGTEGEIDSLYSDNLYPNHIKQVQTIQVLNGDGRIEAKAIVAETVLTSDLTWVE